MKSSSPANPAGGSAAAGDDRILAPPSDTGGFVTAAEAISILWENESINNTTLARYRKIAMRLKSILDSSGIDGIVEVIRGNRRVVVENVECDYYDFISVNSKKAHAYAGSYLIEYSWAEETNAMLDRKRAPKGEMLRIM
ncbi:MAG: hypothetical protein GX647_04560 [Clostridiales bacterium]|nr:hypothetical protein [Clostridiales bacterium]OPZ69917.1 MAG: hypothetical protein BWY81_00201 [Firmicutes bacterium ADurb.Bin467]